MAPGYSELRARLVIQVMDVAVTIRDALDRRSTLCQHALRTLSMRFFLQRSAGIAVLVLILDELVKAVARIRLAPCSGTSWVPCDRLELIGPLWLVRTTNAGSALGFVQGWWGWVVLAAVGLLLIPLYARWLRGGGWVAVIGVGLQVGGTLGNLLDRLVLGGATDVLYVGWGPTWNLADVAIGLGTLFAIWALARQRAAITARAPLLAGTGHNAPP
jgi:signal peptidase II